jgi:hypothetical protein
MGKNENILTPDAQPMIANIPPAKDEDIPEVKNGLSKETILLIAPVAGVVIITSVLIAVFSKSKNNIKKATAFTVAFHLLFTWNNL